jgi:hypothetical protein
MAGQIIDATIVRGAQADPMGWMAAGAFAE